MVDVVVDVQVGKLFLHLLCKLVWGEAHGVDVVCAHAEQVRWGLHDLHGGTQAVVDVHHGQPRVRLQVALKLPRLDGIMEDLNSIVYKEENQGALTNMA